jgi:hypothetical protein
MEIHKKQANSSFATRKSVPIRAGLGWHIGSSLSMSRIPLDSTDFKKYT